MWREWRAAAAMGAGAALLVSGCGGSNEPGGSGGGSGSDCDAGCWEPTTADQEFLESMCTHIESCCVRSAFRAASNVQSCVAQLRQAGLTRNQSVRAACLAEMEELSGSDDCVPEIWNLADPCVRTFYEPSGPQAPGEPCQTSADCAGAPETVTVCSPDPSELSGTGSVCLRMASGTAGDGTCVGQMTADGVIVSAPFYRAGQTEPPVTSGVVCEQRADLYCEATDDARTSKCQQLRADGASCVLPMTCASQSCLTADLGSPSTSGEPGTCTNRVPAGEACLSSGAPAVCDDASACENGTCTAKLEALASCNDDDKCISGNCTTDNVCSPQSGAEALALFAFCARL